MISGSTAITPRNGCSSTVAEVQLAIIEEASPAGTLALDRIDPLVVRASL